MPHKTHYKIHISDVQRYKACRQAWSWSSPIRANLTPRDKYAPFFTGSLVHHCLEMRYKYDAPVNDAIESYCRIELTEAQQTDPKLLEQIELVRGLMKHYELWQKHDRTWLSDAGFEFIASEQTFSVPLWSNSRNSIELIGTFDGVVKNKHNGKTYLWEIKTTRSLSEREKQLQLDNQADAYTNAAQRILGMPIDGIIYTLIRKKIPEHPKIIKGNLLSVAESQDITAEWYLDLVKQHHFPQSMLDRMLINAWIKDQYGNFIDYLAKRGNNYFSRVVVNRSQIELADSWTQLQAVAREMINPKTAIYRSEDHHCNYCLMRQPCLAKFKGQDYATILNNSFVYNERYADEVIE